MHDDMMICCVAQTPNRSLNLVITLVEVLYMQLDYNNEEGDNHFKTVSIRTLNTDRTTILGKQEEKCKTDNIEQLRTLYAAHNVIF